MLWAAYTAGGLFVLAGIIVLCRELARRHDEPDDRELDRILKKIMRGR